jgi:hypothetical protein
MLMCGLQRTASTAGELAACRQLEQLKQLFLKEAVDRQVKAADLCNLIRSCD